jgi:hypothetical protein
MVPVRWSAYHWAEGVTVTFAKAKPLAGEGALG